MNPLRFGIAIGGINCVYYIMAVAISTTELVHMSRMKEKPIYLPLVLVVFFYSLIMAILSGLMVMGAKIKCALLIVPWVFVSAIGLMISTLYLIFIGYTLPIWELFSSITFIATQSISWFSIYVLWKDLHKSNKDKKLQKPQMQ